VAGDVVVGAAVVGDAEPVPALAGVAVVELGLLVQSELG
jgi:hypothetical protein